MAHILQQSPPSLYLKATGILTIIGSFNAAYSEFRGANYTYSKFAQTRQVKEAKKISSRNGMLICYGPSLVASLVFLLYKVEYIGSTDLLSSMGMKQGAGPHLLALASALTIHFLKRELEISEGLQPPGRDLMWFGVALFCIGIGGNFYHHYLLSRLRKNGKTGYVVPSGGLFDLVVCPHYLFEIVDWMGLAFISQTLYSWVSVFWTVVYLSSRSYATRQWYLQKMEDFPKQRKALFPFIF
ncbi:hypothetical protein SUGI_0473110 [Cryptomeria japonica]|nr:hypothetical protein SUGI_0473110 [Cryptomeria japonica]